MRFIIQNLVPMTSDTGLRDVASGAAQGGQLAASSSLGSLARPQAGAFAASHPSTSSAASPQAPRWSSAEDDAPKKGFELCGHNWRKTAAYFAKAAPQNIRSLSALKNRYFCYLDGRSKEEKAASQKRRGRHRAGWGTKEKQQQQKDPVTTPGQAQRRGHTPASPSFPSSSSSFTTPPLPAIKPTTSAGRAWTPNKEKQLLRLALHHQGQDCMATQARAIHEDFCSLYPSVGWSLEEVQVKVGQLMQSEFEEEEEGGEGEGEGEEELEEGEIREGESEARQRGEDVGREEDDNVNLGTMEAGGEEEARDAARAAFEDHAAAIQEAEEQRELAGSAHPFDDEELSDSLSSERAGPTSLRASHPLRKHPLQAAPPQLATEEIVLAQKPEPAQLLDFDHDVKTLPYGLRFKNLPPNSKVSIFSPSNYRIRRLAPHHAAAHALSEQDAQAAFVFHVLDDRSVVAAKLPPRTQTHMEVVPGSEREGESEGSFVAESHFDAECGFKIVFAVVL